MTISRSAVNLQRDKPSETQVTVPSFESGESTDKSSLEIPGARVIMPRVLS